MFSLVLIGSEKKQSRMLTNLDNTEQTTVTYKKKILREFIFAVFSNFLSNRKINSRRKIPKDLRKNNFSLLKTDFHN